LDHTPQVLCPYKFRERPFPPSDAAFPVMTYVHRTRSRIPIPPWRWPPPPFIFLPPSHLEWVNTAGLCHGVKNEKSRSRPEGLPPPPEQHLPHQVSPLFLLPCFGLTVLFLRTHRPFFQIQPGLRDSASSVTPETGENFSPPQSRFFQHTLPPNAVATPPYLIKNKSSIMEVYPFTRPSFSSSDPVDFPRPTPNLVFPASSPSCNTSSRRWTLLFAPTGRDFASHGAPHFLFRFFF